MANSIAGILADLYSEVGVATVGGVLADLSSGTTQITGSQKWDEIRGELSDLEGAITAYSGRIGRVSGVLSDLDGEIIAVSGNKVVLSGAMRDLSGTVVASTQKLALISGVMTDLSGNIVAGVVPLGAISGVMTDLAGSITVLGAFNTFSVNPSLRGVTEYSNFAFDSFFEDGGNYYGVNSTGIYLLSGSNDNGTSISAYLDSGDVEYAKGQQSKILDAHALARTDATLALTLYEDDGAGYTYPSIGAASSVLQQHRFRPGKGAEGRRWRYRLANVAGGSLELQELVLLLAGLSRKR